MATEVKLPRLGQGMESGTIVRWLKCEGDPVRKREPLYELDTDKVTQEVEAEADGVLLKILVAEGEVAVGTTVAVIETNGRAGARRGPRRRGRPLAPTAAPAAAAAAPAVAAPAPGPAAPRPGGRVKASPLARRIARERGVDLAAVVGTGPDGRIVAEDVEQAGRGTGPGSAGAAAARPRWRSCS